VFFCVLDMNNNENLINTCKHKRVISVSKSTFKGRINNILRHIKNLFSRDLLRESKDLQSNSTLTKLPP